MHPSAIIDPGARIGAQTRIWHFCHIMPQARIGKACTLGQNVFVANGVRIGNKVKIQNNVSLYSGVEVADEVFIGPSVVFTNVINPRSAVNRKSEYQNTRLERGVTIGANATIVCGNTLGTYAFVGAGSVVTTDVAPYTLVVGNPARPVGFMSESGHRLEQLDDNQYRCPDSGQRYVHDGQQLRRA